MGGKILLADDSLTIQKVVELTFAETEHRVTAVSGGRELLAQVPQLNPDVVLCDVVMPDMSGYEVCQALKSGPSTLHIPVVLLTGTFEPFDRDRAMASGCDAIITKPFEARELIDTVEQLLERGRAFQATAEEGSSVEGLGVPEGVPALEFTTTGFDKMVPPPPAAQEAPPEEGIELTSGFRADQGPQTQEPAPSEVASGEPVAFEFGEKTAPPFALGPVPAPRPPADQGAPIAAVAPPPAPEQPVAAAPPPAAAEPAAPAAAPALAEGRPLSDAEIDRIARRVVELAGDQVERIAWEVVPDMAEMLVRQRIRELEAAAEGES